MANFLVHKNRRVIPNWRSFGKTIVLGELNSFQNISQFQKLETEIDEYIIDWQINKTVTHAGDLLSAAIVNNKKENNVVIQAANFILNNKSNSSNSQISLANQILNKRIEKDLSQIFRTVTHDTFTDLINPEPIRNKIKEAKQLLKSFPLNPILHVENSRYYSILGQEKNAIESIKIALHLAPTNRFVLRCATRLFAHYENENNDYLEYIHDILRKSPLTSFDPWLTSAEISIATMRQRNSKFIKSGINLINSKNISPFNFTELASSIATVELLEGSLKKSRDFFNKALINPNDNSLAQIEWASTKDKQIILNPANFQVKMNFEALSLDNFHNNNFENALNNAAKWFVDMPFSKRPILFGSNLASIILKDQEKAISFLNAGLISHPNDPQLLNNLAYSLSLDGKPNEAIEHLNKVKIGDHYDETTHICLTATKGLAMFRSGLIDVGRELYLEAIEQAKITGNKDLNWIAILNYAREEILIKSDYVDSIMDTVSKIPINNDDIEITILKNDVINLYRKIKETK